MQSVLSGIGNPHVQPLVSETCFPAVVAAFRLPFYRLLKAFESPYCSDQFLWVFKDSTIRHHVVLDIEIHSYDGAFVLLNFDSLPDTNGYEPTPSLSGYGGRKDMVTMWQIAALFEFDSPKRW